MTRLPIRLRLSLWYFVLFASAAILLSLTSMWMLRRSVDAAEYHELEERAEDVQLLLQHESPGQTLRGLEQEFAAIYQFKDDGKYLQIRDQDGAWIFRSKRMVQQDPPFPQLAEIPPQGVQSEFHQGTRYVRVLSYTVAAQGKRYTVQTGIALNKSMGLLEAFRNGLLFLTPAVIVLAALGGHWMSRKALQPVAALAAQARQINDRNLDTRLPESDTRDEISDLSRTLNQMLQRIDRAFASIRAFTGNASHELRTPISLLRAEIDVALLRPRSAADYQAILMRLNEEAMRMTSLVENLLSLARADGGAEAVSLAPVAVSSLFRSVGRTWAAAMESAQIDLRMDDPEDDLVLLGDAVGLQRLLSILLENAAKFTPPGGRVTVSAVREEARAVLRVQDTGIGIAEADLPRIFDRFYRGPQPGNESARGSGLGLALAKWIADRHGSPLSVKSTPGQGSCFSIALPAVAPAESFQRSMLQTVAD